LARSAAEHLEIAEAAFDAGLGPDAVRAALERAEALAQGAERALVSSAYRQWLGDEEAARRLGPRGARPEEAGLFDWLRARAGASALAHIAQADYGHGAAKHLAALQDICASGLVPRPLAWQPHEVLALTRWTRGADVDHLERALACTLLA